MLDSGPLGRLAHPTLRKDISDWFRDLTAGGCTLFIAEVVDYELRRNFLLHGMRDSLVELDRLKASLAYRPITTPVMLKAAELWADVRRRGMPTADPKELDADVILAAQAIEVGAIIATENVGHLSRYVTALHWTAVTP